MRHYNLVRYSEDGPRLRGRYIIKPWLRLGHFYAYAEVDTIVIKIERPNWIHPTNLKKMIDREIGAEGTYVDPSGEEGEHGGFVYSVTLQRPTSKHIYGVIRLPDNYYDSCSTEKLDVAVDFCPRWGDAEERRELRLQMRNLLVRHLHVDDHWLEGKGTVRWVSNHSSGYLRPSLGFGIEARLSEAPLDSTFYFGKRGGDLEFKIYDKCHDRRRGDDAVELPASKHRVRCELTLRGEQLRIRRLNFVGQVPIFNFRDLMPLFDFRIATIQASHPAGGLLDRVVKDRAKLAIKEFLRGGYACYGALDHTVSPRRKFGHSMAFSELNWRIGKRLNRLQMTRSASC